MVLGSCIATPCLLASSCVQIVYNAANFAVLTYGVSRNNLKFWGNSWQCGCVSFVHFCTLILPLVFSSFFSIKSFFRTYTGKIPVRCPSVPVLSCIMQTNMLSCWTPSSLYCVRKLSSRPGYICTTMCVAASLLSCC